MDLKSLKSLSIGGKAVAVLAINGKTVWEAIKNMTSDANGILSISGKPFTVDSNGIIDLKGVKL